MTWGRIVFILCIFYTFHIKIAKKYFPLLQTCVSRKIIIIFIMLEYKCGCFYHNDVEVSAKNIKQKLKIDIDFFMQFLLLTTKESMENNSMTKKFELINEKFYPQFNRIVSSLQPVNSVGIDSNEQCCICLEPLDKNVVKIKSCNCKNYMHSECLLRWRKKNNSCPLCRCQI